MSITAPRNFWIPNTYPTYAAYMTAVLASLPDSYPESFGYYQAGAWLAEGVFTLEDESLPEKNHPMGQQFWAGYDSVSKT